ncbi:MAG: tetratricopeptide repeat protein [Acidobacteriota bacterium]|nr:tetratricopeptide repeat protein [Acidobacteriota bacterium]
MQSKSCFIKLLVLTLGLALGIGCTSSSASPTSATPPAKIIPAESSEAAIRFLEDRVKRDPDDFPALNNLAGRYLLKLRETGNMQWLELAKRSAQASLKSVQAEQNPEALHLLAQTEFAAHDFAAVRDHARQLVELDGRKAYPHQLLGDALLELGEYEAAKKAFAEMEVRQRGGHTTLIRQARLAQLTGNNERAQRLYSDALQLASEMVPPERETVAWIRWQLGETAFSVGDYAKAEIEYRNSLTTFPNYYRALGGLAKTLAAKGDVNGAIEQYRQATAILPDPVFIAALGDLYETAGRQAEANAQFALLEKMAALAAANGEVYNRVLAQFYADHDLKPEAAYQMAKREYEARRDIYGADALAWTSLKAGKIAEAQTAIKEALRLGTADAKLFFHAGMIARAAGDNAAARDFLQRALKLNPQFDLRQASIAKQAFAE